MDSLASLGGRESFFHTIRSMIPGRKIPGKIEDPVMVFCSLMQQKTIRMQSSPLVLQMLAFRSVPSLLLKLHNGFDTRTLREKPFVGLSKLTVMTLNDMHEVESNVGVSICISYGYVENLLYRHGLTNTSYQNAGPSTIFTGE